MLGVQNLKFDFKKDLTPNAREKKGKMPCGRGGHISTFLQ
jgi:hypothetical protein